MFLKILHRFQVREIGRSTVQASSIWTKRTFRSDLPLCREPSNYSQLASVRTSQQHGRTPFSVRQVERFFSKTQIWEDRCSRPDDVCSRPDALLHKASPAYKVQLTKRQSSWSGCSSFIYGNFVHQFNHSDVSFHGPDAQSLDMKIACS
jgi:hypothetical protein